VEDGTLLDTGLFTYETLLQVLGLNELNQVRLLESQTVDFKSTLDLKPIMKAVCAFSNTIGGRIFLGVKESSGSAETICGVESPKGDLLTWFSNVIGAHVYPAPVFSIRSVALPQSSKIAILLDVRRSEIAPHVIASNIAGDLKDRVLWRYNDKSEPAPFYYVEKLFEDRQASERDQTTFTLPEPIITENPLIGVSMAPKYNYNIILGREHFDQMQSLAKLRLGLPLHFTDCDKVNFFKKDFSGNRYELRFGKQIGAEKDLPNKDDLKWQAAYQLWRDGSFVFCATNCIEEDIEPNIVYLDFIGASIVHTLFAAAEVCNNGLYSHKIALNVDIRLKSGMNIKANSHLIQSYNSFPTLMEKTFSIKQAERIQKNGIIDVSEPQDMTDLLTEILSRIANYGQSPIPTTEWTGYCSELIEGVRRTFTK